MRTPTEATLKAFAHGELSPPEHRRIAALVAADPALHARVAAWREAELQRQLEEADRMQALFDEWGDPGSAEEPVTASPAPPPAPPRRKRRSALILIGLIGLLLLGGLAWVLRPAAEPVSTEPVAPVVTLPERPSPVPPTEEPPETTPGVPTESTPPPVDERPAPTPPAPPSVRPLALAAYTLPADWALSVRGTEPPSTPVDSLRGFIATADYSAAAALLDRLPPESLPDALRREYAAHLAFGRGDYATGARRFEELAAMLPGTARDAADWYGLLAALAQAEQLTPVLRARLSAMADPAAYHRYGEQAATLLRALPDQ